MATPKHYNMKNDIDKYEIDKKTGCFNWLLAKDKDGYALVKKDGKTQRAIRYYYKKVGNTISDDHVLHHKCHNRSCINLDHLKPMTAAENGIHKITDRDMKFDTVNIGGVEIFESGTWKGETYTDNDIDQFIENYNNNIAEPFITIDHSDKASAQFKDALGALSLGFVSGLRRIGNKMIADFKQVPKTIADLIEAGALKKKSIEFYRDFIANGKEYKNVLQGVTFHGANGLPEVNTLSDFLSLYKSDLKTMDTKGGTVSLENKDLKSIQEGIKMDVVELKKDEYNELLKMSSKYTTLQQENEDVKKVNTDVTKKNVELKKENDEIKMKVESQKKANEVELEKEADEFISKAVDDGRVKPAHKDRYIKEYIAYKKDEKLFADFTDDITTRDKVANFTPTKGAEGTQGEFKYNSDKMEFKEGATIDYTEIDKIVNGVMKSKGLSYEAAMIECGFTSAKEIGKKED